MSKSEPHVQLTIDGHSVDIHKPGHDPEKLQKYIASDEGFAAFKEDPKRVLAEHHLSISDELAHHLKGAIAPVQSFAEFSSNSRSGGDFAAFAVAQGAFAMANTKIIAQAVSSIIGGH